MSTASEPVAPPNPAAVPAPTARLTWLDTFRGLSIAMVVLGHVLGGLAFAAFVPEPAKERLWFAYDLLYTFRMPALFLASGLFAARSLKRGLPRFLGDKARTLAYPYLIWSLISWGGLSLAAGMANNQADPMAPLKMLYDPMMGVWFLYVLFVVMTCFGLWSAIGGGAAGFLAVGAVLHAAVPMWAGAPSMLVQVGRFSVYFGLGLVLAEHVRGIGERLSPGRLALLVPTAFAMMKGAVMLGWADHPVLDVVPALCGTLGMFGAAMLLDRLAAAEALRHFGRHSLQLYVAAGHASVATRLMLQRGMGVEALPVHILLGTAAGLAGPLLLVAITRAVGFRYLFTWPRPGDEQRPADRSEPGRSREAVGRGRGRVAGVSAP
ncbi:acyltransferase family protein [Tautonia sociabilis]|uniref:Acyltransferase n=1 Tax=Tautonia sociabilis TaxID=2080755 RepID=A0A432MQA1_9BACT|nr:acyltransferase [Tautonia sociabilis]RUL89661.1 acyltransferase [Tautonia sociabilis]